MTMIYITLAALALTLILSIRMNYVLWKHAEQERDLIGLAVSLEMRAHSAYKLDQNSLDRIADSLKSGIRQIDIARGLIPRPDAPRKLSATQLGKLHKMSTSAIQKRLVQLGYLTTSNGHRFTSLGLRAGGEFRKRDAHDAGFMVWPVDIPLTSGG